MTTWQTPPNFVNNSTVGETELDKLSNDLTYLNHRVQYVKATSSLNPLTTSFQDVPGASITIDQTGYARVTAVFDLVYAGGSGDDGQLLSGTVNHNSIGDFGEHAVFLAISPYRATVTQQYALAVTAGDVLKLRAKKAGGSAASFCVAAGSTLTVESNAS